MACPSQVQSFTVVNTDDALQLANAVNCEGAGSFVVEWTGRVTVAATISVSNGTTLEISSSGSSDATIDGDGAQLLFNITYATLTLSNLKLENGNGTVGGAIAGLSADVKCTNCSFIGNQASDSGGAIAVKESNVSFAGETYCRQNNAGRDGGFLVAMSSSSIVFEGQSTFEENVSLREGGVIYSDEGEVEFTGNSNFYHNAAQRSGGAIWVHNSPLRFSGDESSVNFVNNSAATLFGGAVTLTGKQPLQLEASSVFENNSAPTGGAAYASGRASNSIVNGARFVSNSASLNGGAFVMNRVGNGDSGGQQEGLVLINCTFEDNYSSGDGGAVVVSTGYVQINDTIFRNNVAVESGGAIMSDSGYAPARLALSSCKLLYNRAAVGPAMMNIGSDTLATSVQFYEVTFTGNRLLCGPNQFLLEDSNDTIARENLAYTTACNSCVDLSECDTCVISDNRTVAMCNEVPKYTTSPDADGTLASLSLAEGYWRASNISQKILPCFSTKACEGGIAEMCGGVSCVNGYCAEGYMGPYCSVCEDGYTLGQGYTCVECKNTTARTTQALGIIVLLILAAILARTCQYLMSLPRPSTGRVKSGWQRCMARVHQAIPFQAIKIMIVAWQIITEFAAVANVTFPPYYEAFLSVVKVFNLDLARIVSMGCYFDPNFYDRLLVITIVPLILGGLLLVTFWFAQRRYWGDAQSMMEVRRRHLSVLILITFLVYSSASSTVFQTFACDPLEDGRHYLRADYRLECHRAGGENVVPVHRAYMIYAGIMVIVYPIGIPVLYGLLLWWAWRRPPPGPSVRDMTSRGRSEEDDRFETRRQPSWSWLSEGDPPDRAPTLEPPLPRQNDTNAQEHHQSTMRDLWKPYKQDRLFYEVVECARRVMLTGVVVFIYPGTAAQISTTFLLALVFFAVSETLDPYEDAQDCWVSRFGHLIVLLSMFVALMLRVNLSDEPEMGQDMYGIVLIVANILTLTAILGESVASIYFPAGSVGGQIDFND